MNMEFTQFHPTYLFHSKEESFLISEALRGEGAVLQDYSGRQFMLDYHPMKELAPRDVVARAIDQELKKSGENHVFLDISFVLVPWFDSPERADFSHRHSNPNNLDTPDTDPTAGKAWLHSHSCRQSL